MRMAKEDNKFVQKDIASNFPSNAVLTLSLLQRTGGEMYGM